MMVSYRLFSRDAELTSELSSVAQVVVPGGFL
jgi:hypothetical protein